jgi:hypothetical protein
MLSHFISCFVLLQAAACSLPPRPSGSSLPLCQSALLTYALVIM